MPRQTLALLIGAVILLAALTVAALLWLGNGSIAPLAIALVICAASALRVLLHRRS